MMGRLFDFDEAAKGCEGPGELKIIGDRLGDEDEDESVGPKDGEDRGDGEGAT